jgi:NADPH:quinone reductase-like Zn-dependent oxidoreductase
MRAIVQHEYGSPDLLRLEEIARPTIGDRDAVPLAGLTAWQALEKAPINVGQRVLVTGASGGVGHFAVQIAKPASMRRP